MSDFPHYKVFFFSLLGSGLLYTVFKLVEKFPFSLLHIAYIVGGGIIIYILAYFEEKKLAEKKSKNDK